MIVDYVDVAPEHLVANDQAHDGRLPVVLPCASCRQTRRFLLIPGGYRLEHGHPGVWKATRVTPAGVPVQPQPLRRLKRTA